MKVLRSNEGIALLLALILGLVSVAFLTGIFLMISTGARISGIQRSYTAAVEAARGGATLICGYLRRGITDSQIAEAGWLTVRDPDCLRAKKRKSTDNWIECQGGCETDDALLSIEECYDLYMEAGPYQVYSKVIDTKEFTTATGDTGYIYTVHVLSKSIHDPNDKAWITFLYRVEP